LELFKWYDKNLDLYDPLQELYTLIKSFTKEQDNQIIEKIKEFWLDSDDEAECISYIENI
jgi:Ca2+-binding EF-hand superfamily protein